MQLALFEMRIYTDLHTDKHINHLLAHFKNQSNGSMYLNPNNEL